MESQWKHALSVISITKIESNLDLEQKLFVDPVVLPEIDMRLEHSVLGSDRNHTQPISKLAEIVINPPQHKKDTGLSGSLKSFGKELFSGAKEGLSSISKAFK